VNSVGTRGNRNPDTVVDDARHPASSGHAANPISRGRKHLIAHELVPELDDRTAASDRGASYILMRPAKARKLSRNYIHPQIYLLHFFTFTAV
jgi:hypothetical protein